MKEIAQKFLDELFGHLVLADPVERAALHAKLQAMLPRLESDLRYVAHRYRRWNIEEEGTNLLICQGEHEKSEGCDMVRYVPQWKVDAMVDVARRVPAGFVLLPIDGPTEAMTEQDSYSHGDWSRRNYDRIIEARLEELKGKPE